MAENMTVIRHGFGREGEALSYVVVQYRPLNLVTIEGIVCCGS